MALNKVSNLIPNILVEMNLVNETAANQATATAITAALLSLTIPYLVNISE